MTLLAGQLRHTITIQGKTTTTGDRGQAVATWTTKATLPAMIEELGGRKLELARQLVATATHKVTIRFLSSLGITDRILFSGRTFNIGSIQDTKLLGFSQELLCTEQVSGAV